jgi:hypothetical protein
MQSLAVGLSRAEDGYRIVFRKSGKFQLAGKGKKKSDPTCPTLVAAQRRVPLHGPYGAGINPAPGCRRPGQAMPEPRRRFETGPGQKESDMKAVGCWLPHKAFLHSSSHYLA